MLGRSRTEPFRLGPPAVVTLADLIEIVRDLTRRVAMLEVEDAGRQAARLDVEADEDA